jgi:nitrogen regulatory protein P-II 1
MENVIEELDKIQVYRKTVSNVLGIGISHTEVYRGLLETGNLVKKVRFEIAINDEKVNPVIEAITRGAHNEDSDGKIFIINLEDCIQLGTNIRGPDAIGQ